MQRGCLGRARFGGVDAKVLLEVDEVGEGVCVCLCCGEGRGSSRIAGDANRWPYPPRGGPGGPHMATGAGRADASARGAPGWGLPGRLMALWHAPGPLELRGRWP